MLRTILPILFVLGAVVVVGFAAEIDRTKPPQTPPIPGYKLPPIREASLSNGLSVVLVEDARFPLVTVRLGFNAGTKYDPKDLAGLSEATAALLIEGTKTRTSRQIAEELAAIGGTLQGVSGPDGLTVAGSALAEQTPKLLALLADVAQNASFPEDEIQLYKQNRKQGLLAERSDPGFLATEKLTSVLYGSSGYAHIAPTLASIDRIDRNAVSSFRDARVVPNNAVLILLGRLPGRAETMKLIQERFGSWQRKEVPVPAVPEFPPGKRRIVLVDRPGSVQADIHVGRLAITRKDPDYYPLLMGSLILGGGASSRMFANIREKHGFAYDAHSTVEPRKDAGIATAVTQVRNDVLEPAMKALFEELEGMGKAPVTAEELADTKNYASGLFLLRLETQNGVADQLNMMRITGLPDQYLEEYTARVRAVTPEQVQAAAKKYIVPADVSIVVAGDAGKIQKSLEKFGEVTVVKAE